LAYSVNRCQQVASRVDSQMLDFIISNHEKIKGERQRLHNLLNEISQVESKDKRLL